ncbi:uncharacterized protein LOC135487584 isoform X2 [Lineus longissimus]
MKTSAYVITSLLLSFSGSALSQTCAERAFCGVNVTEMDQIKHMFEQDVVSWGILGVNFWVKGIDWDSPSNDSDDVFNPNWWSWYLEEAGSLIDMPLDYDILSIGLLSLRIKDYDLEFTSSPPGCLSALPYSCKRQIVHEKLLMITQRDEATHDELICQTAMHEKSLLTGNTVGLSKKCCKRESLKNGTDEYTKDGAWQGRHYSVKRLLVFLFGTVLPLFSIPLVMAWADFKPLDVGHGFVDYASNKLCKFCHFKLRGSSNLQPLDQRTVIMRENDLIEFEGPVMTLTSIADFDFPIKAGKMKFTILFLLQYIPIGLWLYYYNEKKDSMKYLDSWEKILFNLRFNPFSWLCTDPQFWPYKFALFLIVLNSMSFVGLCIWWLLESAAIRKAFMNLLIKSSLYGKFKGRGKFKARRTGVPLEKIFRNLFIALFTTIMIGTYMVVFSFFHSAIYTIGGVVVNIELVASWLTGLALVIYYVNKSYTGVKAKYTDIKRLVFEESLLWKVYKGSILMTCDVLVNDSENNKMVDRDKQVFKYEWVKAEGPILLYNKDNNLMLPRRMFLRICEKLEPLKENVKKAAIDLTFTLFFLGLVVFTIAVFRPYNASSEMSVVVTSVVTLLTALIPQLAEMTNCQEQDNLEKSVLHYKVRKAVHSYRPNFRTLVDTSTFSPKATMIRRLSKEDYNAINPDIMAPLGTKFIGDTDSGLRTANDFNPSSSLPSPVNTLVHDGLRPPILPTIHSVGSASPLVAQRANNNARNGHRPAERLTSNDSGLMVLDLRGVEVQNQHDPDEDDLFIDDSFPKTEV